MDEQRVPIRSITEVGAHTVAIELATPTGFSAHPGQFVLVRATIDGEDVARHYTLSSPSVTETFELTVGIDPEGAFSGWLTGRKPGDELTIEGPFGTVFYDDDGPVRVLAGGPGIGAGLGVAERAASLGYEVAFVAESDDGVIHRDRFEALAGEQLVIITDADEFDDGVERAYTERPDATTYVFGFNEFVVRAIRAIESAGGDPNEARMESYG